MPISIVQAFIQQNQMKPNDKKATHTRTKILQRNKRHHNKQTENMFPFHIFNCKYFAFCQTNQKHTYIHRREQKHRRKQKVEKKNENKNATKRTGQHNRQANEVQKYCQKCTTETISCENEVN